MTVDSGTVKLRRARRRKHPCNDQCENHWCRHLAFVQDLAAGLGRLENRLVSVEARIAGLATQASQTWLTEQLHTLAAGQSELYRRVDWLRARLDDDGEAWKHG
jgi:hypothetical protein